MSRNRTLIAVALTVLAGCSGVPPRPTYTQDDLMAMCQHQGGWWHPNGLVGGHCEYDSRL
jgi:hypothetical protein